MADESIESPEPNDAANVGGGGVPPAPPEGGGGGAGQRGDGGDALHHRRAAHGAVVEERLTAERRVDHQSDPAIQEFVADMGSAFVHLENDFHVEPMHAQEGGGAAGGDEVEAERGELAGASAPR